MHVMAHVCRSGCLDMLTPGNCRVPSLEARGGTSESIFIQTTASMRSASLLTVAFAASATAHIVITYPGTRGHNLVTNETYPAGMQFVYPCMRLLASRYAWDFIGTDA